MLVAFQEMPEHFLSAGEYNGDTRSHHYPGAQLWVGSSRIWSVFLGRP